MLGKFGTVVCAGLLGLLAAQAGGQTATCRRLVLSGEVSFGQEYEQPIGNGLRLMLEPLASGWILRVLPATGPRGQHDYAELATPPYQSMTPLLISTDYSFRAQDVIGWNPRRFHYAANAEEFRRLSGVYESYMKAPTPQVQAQLAEMVERAPEGELEILDAKIIAGQADQGAMANSVVSHFLSTAHTVEPPDGKESSALGRVLGMRFRIRLSLTPGSAPPRGLMVEKYPCIPPERPTSPPGRASH